ncbi:MAG: RluA family pseudouridine synthase [Candidatus Omnitrophica bacterium]|nr:RluA family pseudouridine synthase [Candidatus Omnitrophota bacterium]
MGVKGYKIIYEDEWIIVADKPSGMLVIPTPRKEKNTLTHLLNDYLDRKGVLANAYPCHRLDRETSGLVIFAKGKSAQQRMMESFRSRAVKKSYVAFVQGIVRNNSGAIKSPIYNRNKKRKEPALTEYAVRSKKRDYSILEVIPVTGRTNQIRIHMASVGHPIVGESVYAYRKDFKLRFRRTALHAHSLEFQHPVTGARLKLIADLPEDMREFLDSQKQ